MTAVRRTAIGLAVAVLVVAALAPYWTAAALIARAAGASGFLGTVSRWAVFDVSSSLQPIPTRTGAIRGRVFRPEEEKSRPVLLVSGIHRDGIDEPRLMALAEELAATGRTVVTPEIEDLMHYKVTPQVTDTIEDTAKWMAMRRDISGGGAIGLIGVSFSGGLSIVAAGRPSVRGKIAYVLSFGGHGNLPRVLRYLCTGEGGPDAPHPYGLAVLLHQSAEFVVPVEQVAHLKDTIDRFLDASAINRHDPEKAQLLFAELRARSSHMPDPSASLMRHLTSGDVASLGARITPHLSELGHDPALSPDRSPPPTATVYLLHGANDNIIPPQESTRLAEYLRAHTRVRHLLSGFLTHADVAEKPDVDDTVKMIAFWTALLTE